MNFKNKIFPPVEPLIFSKIIKKCLKIILEDSVKINSKNILNANKKLII